MNIKPTLNNSQYVNATPNQLSQALTSFTHHRSPLSSTLIFPWTYPGKQTAKPIFTALVERAIRQEGPSHQPRGRAQLHDRHERHRGALWATHPSTGH
ncbi:Uncharacterized protein FKW44_016945 [Caligus rogercresseyi]|uniref:Uncharacterized protein n=1 Tax=Caligus rogercresseyi TaxID=217165 RepID=A0A7T8K2G8_CALRO|nr:Uncharacterized protein FKW44_016945 [Caligus rogercresseyi]